MCARGTGGFVRRPLDYLLVRCDYLCLVGKHLEPVEQHPELVEQHPELVEQHPELVEGCGSSQAVTLRQAQGD